MEVESYLYPISRLAQTTLRSVYWDMRKWAISLTRREALNAKLQSILDQHRLDVGSPDFLVLSRHPMAMNYKHFIPWKRIVEIVFLDA